MKTNTTVKISDRMELVGFLRSIGTECKFVTLETETVVKMRKTANPYYGTVKVSRRNGMVNINFVGAVERNMKKAGIENPMYVPGETWYIHENSEEGKPIALCVHKKDHSRFYLQYFPLRNLETRYVLNGTELTKDQVEEMKQFVYEDEKDEWKPIVITLAIDSIRSVTFRRIKMLNHTFSRLVAHLSRIKNKVTKTV